MQGDPPRVVSHLSDDSSEEEGHHTAQNKLSQQLFEDQHQQIPSVQRPADNNNTEEEFDEGVFWLKSSDPRDSHRGSPQLSNKMREPSSRVG